MTVVVMTVVGPFLSSKDLSRILVPLVFIQEVQHAREELAEGMRGAMGGFADAVLERLMRAGVAWHHAGMAHSPRHHS